MSDGSEGRPSSVPPPSIRVARRDIEAVLGEGVLPTAARSRGFRLQTKAALVVAATILGMVLVLYIPLRLLLLANFDALERRQAELDLDRARAAVSDEQQSLARSALDYSAWDDAYAFAASAASRPTFVPDNFFDETFDQQGWSAIVMTNANGEVLYSRFYDLDAKHDAPPEEALVAMAREQPAFRPTVRAKAARGVVFIGDRAWLVAAHPVVPSVRDEPARGVLFVARAWEPSGRARVNLATQLDVWLARVEGNTERRLKFESSDVLVATTPVGVGEAGSPAEIGFRLDRALAREGRRNALVVLGVMLAAGALLTGAILVALRRVVLKRLAALSRMARNVQGTQDLAQRSGDKAADELGILGRSFDAMLGRVQRLVALVEAERATSDSLLLNVMPAEIARRLKAGEHPIADAHENVTVVFADLVGFTSLAETMPPATLVELLGGLFTELDTLAERYEVEKIKTIGDAYMAASGLLRERDDHCEVAIRLALDMIACVATHNERHGTHLALRIGLHCGPVVAGVIGESRFVYDVWGDTVNTASRMESTGLPNRVQVSRAAHELTKHAFEFEARAPLSVKGKGEMMTFLVVDEALSRRIAAHASRT